MAEGRRRETWSHTSALLAMLFNVNRSSKTPAAEPADFHPMVESPKRAVRNDTPLVFGLLKQTFSR